MGNPEAQSQPGSNNPLRSAVAGAFAGAVSKTSTAPIERVKLLLQVRSSNSDASKYYGNTVWQVTKDVYRQEGFLAFWRGNTPSVIQKAGGSALNFLLMDSYKMTISQFLFAIGKNPKEARTLNSFLSAGLAGGTTTTLMYPLEFLRTRLAVDMAQGPENRKFAGMRDVLAHAIRKDGIWGIYQGFGTSLWFVTLHRVVYLGGFDVLKTKWLMRKRRQQLNFGERLVIAQSVSMLAGTVCYPLDTVRRRLMMQAGGEGRLYKNWLDCVVKIYTNEGVFSFFRGLLPNLAKTVGGALLLVAYDSVRGIM